MTHFAGHTERLTHTARDLAAETHIPLPTVSKLLKLLARQGLLLSHRGMRGGYSLAKKPEEISVAHIVGALDGPVGLTDCTVHPGKCGQEETCPSRSHLQLISSVVHGALDQIVLSTMTRPAAKPIPLGMWNR